MFSVAHVIEIVNEKLWYKTLNISILLHRNLVKYTHHCLAKIVSFPMVIARSRCYQYQQR